MGTSHYKPERDKVLRFYDASEYAAHLRELPQEFRYMSRDTSFYGMQYDLAVKMLEQGDMSSVALASKFVDKMQDAQIFSIGQPQWENAIVGYHVNVAAFMAGHPKHMMRRAVSEYVSTMAPLSVYVDVTVSAFLSHQQLIARGVAMLAFVMAMSQIRPVELYCCGCGHYNDDARAQAVVCKVESKPLDLARAAFMLTNPAYNRRISFSAGTALAGVPGNYSIPLAFNRLPHADLEASMRHMLSMEAHDIYLKHGHMDDSLMLSDPVKWVRNMIEKHARKSTDGE